MLFSAQPLKLAVPFPQSEEQAGGGIPKPPNTGHLPEFSGTLLRQLVTTDHSDVGTEVSGTQ